MEHSSVTLSQSEWRVMEALWAGPKTLMELVRELGSSAGWAKSTVTTMVRRMEEKGLLSYEQSGPGQALPGRRAAGRTWRRRRRSRCCSGPITAAWGCW